MEMIKNTTRVIKKVKKVYLIIFLILFAAAIYFVLTQNTQTPEEIQQEKVAKAISDASKHILLPSEAPQIFDITDPAVLISQQQFFSGSISGDVLLVYPASAKAIIWSPSRNIVVNSGPIQSDNISNDIQAADTELNSKK